MDLRSRLPESDDELKRGTDFVGLQHLLAFCVFVGSTEG
jgi:hypothetical protein